MIKKRTYCTKSCNKVLFLIHYMKSVTYVVSRIRKKEIRIQILFFTDFHSVKKCDYEELVYSIRFRFIQSGLISFSVHKITLEKRN